MLKSSNGGDTKNGKDIAMDLDLDVELQDNGLSEDIKSTKSKTAGRRSSFSTKVMDDPFLDAIDLARMGRIAGARLEFCSDDCPKKIDRKNFKSHGKWTLPILEISALIAPRCKFVKSRDRWFDPSPPRFEETKQTTKTSSTYSPAGEYQTRNTTEERTTTTKVVVTGEHGKKYSHTKHMRATKSLLHARITPAGSLAGSREQSRNQSKVDSRDMSQARNTSRSESRIASHIEQLEEDSDTSAATEAIGGDVDEICVHSEQQLQQTTTTAPVSTLPQPSGSATQKPNVNRTISNANADRYFL
uniref:Uncharacterized protein n=1 Tax=Bigelowiella natans TaxID=227086 RepID=A0A7S2KI71_BIGNA